MAGNKYSKQTWIPFAVQTFQDMILIKLGLGAEYVASCYKNFGKVLIMPQIRG